MKRNLAFVLLLFLFIGILFCIDPFTRTENTDMHVLCKKNLEKNHDILLKKIHMYQGECVARGSKAFGSFSALFDGDLAYVDLRNSGKTVFSFSVLSPETSKRLIYCPENRIQIVSNTFLEGDENEVRVENLGINGKGYIWCKRLKTCWFYWESYLPT